jgi:uncharacterized membrane protein YhfC
MIPVSSMIAMITTFLICLLFPLILFYILRRKSRNVTGAFIAGAVAFYLSQGLIRLPLLQYILPKFSWYESLYSKPVFIIPFLAVSAALFEETARYLVFVLLLKERQVWKCGIAFGIGHGGMEAFFLVGLTYINNIVLAVMINRNTFFSFLADKMNTEKIMQIYDGIKNASPEMFFAAGIERILTIFIHIGLSVMILEGIVRNKRSRFYLLAFFTHAFINSFVLFLSNKGLHLWLIELVIAVFALCSILYTKNAKKRFNDKIEAVDEGKKAIDEGY